MMRFRVLLVLPLALALAAGGALLARPAAASLTIGVTPSLLELKATPGSTGTQELTVSNQGDEAFDATVDVAAAPGATEAASAASWLTAAPAQIHLAPNTTQKLTVTIAVPRGLASGGYYALVTVTTGATQIQGSGAGIAGRLGVPFLFTVTGTGPLTKTATLEKFAPVLEADGRVGFRALLRNSGNLYVVASGQVAVNQADGKKYASLDFPATTAILPANERLLQTQGTIPMQPGAAFTAAATIDFGAKQTLAGTAAFTFEPPAVAASGLGVCENLDRGPTLTATLRNDGDLGALPAVKLAVRQKSGSDLGAASLPQPPIAWPHDRQTITADFPQRLVTGAYVFTLTVQTPSGQPMTTDFPFQIGGTGANVAPLCPAAATPGT